TLRLAFSADISKPFELKPSFPYGSPSDSYHPSPPLESQYHSSPYGQVTGSDESRLAYVAQPITPPISAKPSDKPDSPPPDALGLMHDLPQNHNPMVNIPLVDGNSWDPTRIITYDQRHVVCHICCRLTLLC